VRAEIAYGMAKKPVPEPRRTRQARFLAEIASLPFDDAAAEIAGRVRAGLDRAGTPIGPYDLLIAAIALAHDLTLVTHNRREFGRVPGLRTEDWEAAIPPATPA
jgi:tRNA(fMet)-specific endonuclease VapC